MDALAREHEAATFAAALVARLLADGRPELAAAVASLLDGAAVDPNPPDRHRAADMAAYAAPRA